MALRRTARPMSAGRSFAFATPFGLVTVTAAPETAARAREADHLDFLATHWAELSAAAFEGYGRHGAGAVVLWRTRAPRRWRREAAFEPERLWYTTQVHVLPGATEADFDGWEAGLIEVYDPRAEAVVLFVEGTLRCGYRVSGTPTPPEAHRRNRVGLN